MIFHPAVISLSAGSLLVSCMLLYSSWFGAGILRKWDLRSGSELQLSLERRTYLISTILSYAFGFQLISFFLFVFTADHLHILFTGAMCAAGTLNVSQYGYPAIVLKAVNFILVGLWLIMNYTDNKAFDYPLIRKKYTALLILTPLMLAEMLLQGAYFLGLRAAVITSCCGSLFSGDSNTVAAEIVSLPRRPLMIVFYAVMPATILLGIIFSVKGRAGTLFAMMSVIAFFISTASLISFISPYIYELPTHHCPFCVLQKEYSYTGYLYYIFLMGGVVCGAGTGLLMPFRKIISLKDIVPAAQRRLTLVSVVLYLLFTALVTAQIVFSNLKMNGL
jgi:hypothetical protein